MNPAVAVFIASLVMPWPGEHGITIETPGLIRPPRPYTSAIVYRPDGTYFYVRRRAVRYPTLASIRFPQQPSGTTIYVTVEQDGHGYGLPLVVP